MGLGPRPRKGKLENWQVCRPSCIDSVAFAHILVFLQTKKVKVGAEAPVMNSSAEPKKNIFQRIQSGVQRLNRGKPKGQFLQSKKPSKDKRGPRSI
jgi:hypothetical protein